MPKTKKTIKAWAVIDTKNQDTSLAVALIYNLESNRFSRAIFLDEDGANSFVRRFIGKLKLKSVPCTITYTLPAKKKTK